MHDQGHARENVIRRLEAFSDVVIGFSLAQLGLSLVIPAHAVDFVQRPVGLVAFFVTFLIVVRFWWTHFRIFRSYFEPNRLMMTLNFVALAALIVQVFSLQLYLHFVPLGQGMVAARIYFGFFVVSYGILALMFVAGMFFRRKLLSAREFGAGVRDSLAIIGAVTGCVIGSAVASDPMNVYVAVENFKKELVAVAPTAIFLGTFVGWIVGIAVGRICARFVVARRPA
jgi:uncharacterized membrane protein